MRSTASATAQKPSASSSTPAFPGGSDGAALHFLSDKRRGERVQRTVPFRCLCPLAFLQGEVPVLRFQQPCPGGDRSESLAARTHQRARPLCRRNAGAGRVVGLLRRRNTLAYGAGDGGGPY